MKIKIEEISNSNEFFSREEINDDLVNLYSELLETGVELPPITVFKDDVLNKYTIIDGFHTYHAALKLELDSIGVELTNKDTPLDRFTEAVIKNSTHGHPLSRRDRRRNIEKILSFEEAQSWSDQEIAKIIGVSDRTVASVRKSLPSPKISEMKQVKCIRNGKPHTVTIGPSHGKTNKDKKEVSIDAPKDSANDAQILPEGNSGDQQSSSEASIPEEQKLFVVTQMKALEQKCLTYTKLCHLANDGDQNITRSFLENLMAILTEFRAEAERAVKIIDEIMGEAQ